MVCDILGNSLNFVLMVFSLCFRYFRFEGEELGMIALYRPWVSAYLTLMYFLDVYGYSLHTLWFWQTFLVDGLFNMKTKKKLVLSFGTLQDGFKWIYIVFVKFGQWNSIGDGKDNTYVPPILFHENQRWMLWVSRRVWRVECSNLPPWSHRNAFISLWNCMSKNV